LLLFLGLLGSGVPAFTASGGLSGDDDLRLHGIIWGVITAAGLGVQGYGASAQALWVDHEVCERRD
jgi:hypothetical protein